jgi:hypothetical protein
MTPLKFKIFVSGPQHFFKGNILQNYFIGKYPLYHIYTLNKRVGEFVLHFVDFRSDYLGEYNAIWKTALARGSVSSVELMQLSL